MNKSLHIIILAAGQGTRMYSSLPKVLHRLAGKPLLHHVLDTAMQLGGQKIHVVYGHGGEAVMNACKSYDVNWVFQEEQNGTGHAVEMALHEIPDDSHSLILYGDVPLLSADTLQSLIKSCDQLGVLSAVFENPSGYGRIIREDGHITGIIEERDASPKQRLIREINTGVLLADSALLKSLLKSIDSHNDQGEFYLVDCISMAYGRNIIIDSLVTHDEHEVAGANTRRQLADIERHYQLQKAYDLMDAGVHVLDPSRIDIRGSLDCGRDVVIDVNCIFCGNVILGDGVMIGPNTLISDSTIGSGVVVKSNCVIESAAVGEASVIGPYARLRPGVRLAFAVHIGNFVEIKNSGIGAGSKVNHLSYIGDSDIGQNVNIGAGTITCNYDGASKHRTLIEDNAFIGSGNELVAPITIGEGATTGAGSTLTQDVQAQQLSLSRSRQRNITGWKRSVKK